MKLTNLQIHTLAQAYLSAFQNADFYLPAKVNFYIQRNSKKLIELAQDIEKARLDIVNHYGKPVEGEDDKMAIAPEDVATVNQELLDLFGIEQEIEISTFNIEALGDIKLSMEQMEAIMFMIAD